MLLVCHLFRADPPLSVHPPSKLLSGTALQSPCIWLTHSGLSPPSHPPLRYGLAATHELLARLQCVWISHIHADHHAGLVRVLAARRDVLRERAATENKAPSNQPSLADGASRDIPPLLVIGPRQLQRYLEAYSKLENLHCTFLDCSQTTKEAEALASSGSQRPGLISPSLQSHSESQGLRPFWTVGGYHLENGLDEEGRRHLGEVLSAMGLRRVESVPVVHCPQAFAVVVEALPQREGVKGRRGRGRLKGHQ